MEKKKQQTTNCQNGKIWAVTLSKQSPACLAAACLPASLQEPLCRALGLLHVSAAEGAAAQREPSSRGQWACVWAHPRSTDGSSHPFISLPSSRASPQRWGKGVWFGFLCVRGASLTSWSHLARCFLCNLLHRLGGGQGQMAWFRLIKGLSSKEKRGGSCLAWYLFLALSTGGWGDKLGPDGDQLHCRERGEKQISP